MYNITSFHVCGNSLTSRQMLTLPRGLVSPQLIQFSILRTGGKSTRSFRQNSDTSSGLTSSKKSGRDYLSQHGRKLGFTRHHSHGTGAPLLSHAHDLKLAGRTSKAVDEAEASDNESLPRSGYGSEDGNSKNVSFSTVPVSLNALDENLKGISTITVTEKRRKLSFIGRAKSSSVSAGTPRPNTHKAISSNSVTSLTEGIESSITNQRTVRIPSLLRRQSSERRPVSLRKLRRQSSAASSDTDYQDGDAIVPGVEAFLDNSKTLGSLHGVSETPDANETSQLNRKSCRRDIEALDEFKYEIVRLTHTLKIKGWRNVSMEKSAQINVERLSGALTNAVYVVTPPKDLPTAAEQFAKSSMKGPIKALPAKLLLRIYGPNVSHLIDRESELAILRRLARQHIGPRLLGTFSNGRFEQYYNARPLTATDLRAPDTSCQVAKRMRELHDGIALLRAELEAGPCVWRNWDRWVSRCENIVGALDRKVKNGVAALPAACILHKGSNQERTLLCGTEWRMFRQAVERYRSWLAREAGGDKEVEKRLVFAHNDTQYGNILRLLPSGTSPLLLPANEHKQLIVIDFEYAGANVPGLEFANHFSEWCYDYYDPEAPYALTHQLYPSTVEQERFIKAYIMHGAGLPLSTSPETTSNLSGSENEASTGPGGVAASLAAFMLDARMPMKDRGRDKDKDRSFLTHRRTRTRASSSSSATSTLENSANLEDLDQDISAATQTLMRETRLWRPANTAQWVAWGIVQATIPELADDDGSEYDHQAGKLERGFGPELEPDHESSKINQSEKQNDADDLSGTSPTPPAATCVTDFDYLSYARDRALLFWGDLVAFGIVDENELPVEVRERLKMVEN